MRRRKLVVALAGLAVVVVLWPRASSRITEENSNRIRRGMTPSEVEAILGKAGDYRSGPTEIDVFTYWPNAPTGTYWPNPPVKNPPVTYWESDTGQIGVWFADDRAMRAKYTPLRRVPQGPLDALLWRAKRQWHRWFPE
jgi:hypothetical protein